MKGGSFYGLKGKQFSLLLIALVCATILLWAWEKTPLLATLLPPQSRVWMPYPVIPINATSDSSTHLKSDTHVKKVLSHFDSEKETTEQAEKNFDVEAPLDFLNRSSPYTASEEEMTGQAEQSLDVEAPLGFLSTDSLYSNSATPPVEKKETDMSVEEEDAKHKQQPEGEIRAHQSEKSVNPEGETRAQQSEESVNIVAPLASVITSSSVERNNDTDPKITMGNNDTDSKISPLKKQETDTRVEEEDAKLKQQPEGETRAQQSEKNVNPEGETRAQQLEESVNVVAPMGSSVKGNNDTDSKITMWNNDTDSEISPVKKQACNYAKGKWVADNRRPLYSGFGCKQWLSGMWACRLTQRTEFSYESFRWQPENCMMPEFEGSKFLRRMQDKTLALVGDSLGRQQFQSLMCMVTGGKQKSDVIDVGWEYGLVKARGSIRPDGWAYRFPRTNTTILYYWSASLCDLEPLNITNPSTDYAMHLDRPAAFLQRYLHRFDVLVLNSGHHWNRGKIRANRWKMYVGGVPNTNRQIADIGGAKNFTIYSVVKWLDSQLPKHPRLKAFFRTISPRHFFHGDWNSGGSCDNTTPLAGGKEVLQDESSDLLAVGAVMGTRVKLLDITALSQLRDEGHISRYSIKATPGVQDCLHWCLPGIPDSWNEILSAQL